MIHPLRIELLGRLRAQCGERVVERFRTQKEGALFAFLAYHAQRPHLREQLTEMLWPDAEPEAGRNRLKQTLSTLRRQLEPPGTPDNSILAADRVHVRLTPAAFSTDAHDFETALRNAARADTPEAKSAALLRAVETYTGELLPGYYEDWILTERQRLADAFVGAVRQVIPDMEQRGEWERALDFAHRAVAADPYLEEAHGDVMRLYARLNRQNEVVRHYRHLEHLLEENLGAAPGATLRQLYAQITRGDFKSDVSSKPAVSSAALPPGSTNVAPPIPQSQLPTPLELPLQFTRFFGRETELERVHALLHEAKENARLRLITVTGPGGSGKSRFAMETAKRIAETWDGAVWFVPLADVTDPRQIADAIAEALHLPPDTDGAAIETLVNHLTPRPALLILDNMEQLLVADNPLYKLRNPKSTDGAAFVWRLISQVPSLTCLVTSRQALELNGEREFPLLPLPVPDDMTAAPEALLNIPSVHLFVDRAQAVAPDFQITPRNGEAIATLCARLEGIPLALELAAARVRVFSPAQMVGQLSRRFDFLVSRQRNAEERHRTLWAAIEWSFFHLPPELRDFFVGLSVFRGGWTIDSAASVCAVGAENETEAFEFAAECLSQLRVHSLILAEEGPDSHRFRMLETLREFAASHLRPEEEHEAKRRHAVHFAALAEQAMPYLSGAEQTVWLDRLHAEHDNFRAALDWCEGPAGDGKIGLHIVRYLWRFWQMRGFLIEGRDRIARILALPAVQDRNTRRGDVLNGAGNLAIAQADYPAAQGLHEQALAIRREAEDEKGVTGSLNNLGIVALNQEDYHAARHFMESALARYRAQNNANGVSLTLINLGRLAQKQQDFPGSLLYLEEALALNRELGNRSGESLSVGNLGVTAYLCGDYALAEVRLTEALAISRELGDRTWQATLLGNLGHVACDEEKFEEANVFFAESLLIHQETGKKIGVRLALDGFGFVAVERGDFAAAVRWLAAAESLCAASGTPRPPVHQAEIEQALALVREHLGTENFTRQWNAACETPLEQILHTVLHSAKHSC